MEEAVVTMMVAVEAVVVTMMVAEVVAFHNRLDSHCHFSNRHSAEACKSQSKAWYDSKSW